MTKDIKAMLILSALVCATAFPFIHRAYFVDDYYFVTMAKGIVDNPWRPYDFKSDDAGLGNVAWERGQKPRMVNPPLFHYYLAGVIAMFGSESWKLRAASLLFSFIALFCMYFLGKRFVRDPLTAAIFMAVCPAYWLTSYSLLIDGALVAFLLASLLAFVHGHENRDLRWILASGLLMGLTMLVKYFGAIVLPLALLWQVVDPKRRTWWASYSAYGVFLGIQILWAVWNVATYGQSHLLSALGRGMGTPSLVAWAQKGLIVAGFAGGAGIFVLFASALLWRVSKPWLSGLVGFGAGLFVLFSSRVGGFDSTQSALLAIFVSGTLSFLVAMSRILNRSNPIHLFLGAWVAIGLVELVVVMPWTAGRYLLCVLPALSWVFCVMIEDFEWPGLEKIALIATAVMGLLLALADYNQANTIVHLADRLWDKTKELQVLSPKPDHKWYYLADTFDGSQPYLLPLGWENVLPHQKFKKGDLFLRAYYRKSSWWNVDEELKQFKPVVSIEMRSKNPLRVMDVPASAGFYASCWGALPWTITDHPLERFELYQAISE